MISPERVNRLAIRGEKSFASCLREGPELFLFWLRPQHRQFSESGRKQTWKSDAAIDYKVPTIFSLSNVITLPKLRRRLFCDTVALLTEIFLGVLVIADWYWCSFIAARTTQSQSFMPITKIGSDCFPGMIRSFGNY